MKKSLVIFIFFVFLFNTYVIYANSNETSNDEILNSQEKELGISDFIKASEDYTNNKLDGINIQDFFKSAITGQVGNINIFNIVLNVLGKEFKSTISSVRNYTYNNYYTQHFIVYK